MKNPQIICPKCGVFNEINETKCWKCKRPISGDEKEKVLNELPNDQKEQYLERGAHKAVNSRIESAPSKKKYVVFAAFVLIAILMVFTNPKMNDFALYAQNEVARGVQENNAGGLGALLGGIGAALIVNSTVRDNYLFFSVYSAPSQGKTTKFIGILGKFFEL